MPRVETIGNATLYLGDCRDVLGEMESNSVALSFWSPPYFLGKQYEKESTIEDWQLLLKQAISSHSRILKPGGFLVINIADILCFEDETIPRFQAMNPSQQRSEITRDKVLEAKSRFPHFSRYELAAHLGVSEQTIDRRLNGNNIRGGKYNAETRVRLIGGELESFAYGSGLYLYDKRIWAKDPAWANSQWTTNSLKAVSEYEDLYIFWKPGQQILNRNKLSDSEWKKWGSRGIWFIDSVRKNDDHEAKFPLELAMRIVLLFSEAGDLVIDPFLGSGTTGVACMKHGRKFIGIEKEPKYFDLANRYIRDVWQQGDIFSMAAAQ